jgi:4-alpha-glucanotransferase
LLRDLEDIVTEPPRRACVLMPLFSLRDGGWGVGEIPDLPRFARWASASGFGVVQLLPVSEVCGGETSPYAASSAFAIDPVYLGLDACEDFRLAGGRDALTPEDRRLIDELARAPSVRWGEVRGVKARAAALAFARFEREEWTRETERARELGRFMDARKDWLEDDALFSVLHERFASSWLDWEPALRDRLPGALQAARQEHRQAILHRSWLQWQLDAQWHRARTEAAALGVELMGDLPFVVATDSADVWSHRDIFHPELRVGTPPDAFSAEGQDWGLPLYDWAAMERSGFAWFRARAARAGELYSLYRVDHVIGLYRTFFRSADGSQSGFVPPEKAEQIRLGETLLPILSEAGEVVAEDLGMVPPFLRPSLTKLGIPGYKVMRWEKEEAPAGGDHPAEGQGDADRPAHAAPHAEKERKPRIVFHDPATWPVLSVAASGTHDIETNAEWYDLLPAEERAALARIPGLELCAQRERFDDAVRDALLRALYAAPSELAAIPFQDVFGARERINVPGTVNETNWTYRMPMSLDALAGDRATSERMAHLSRETARTRG